MADLESLARQLEESSRQNAELASAVHCLKKGVEGLTNTILTFQRESRKKHDEQSEEIHQLDATVNDLRRLVLLQGETLPPPALENDADEDTDPGSRRQ